MGPHTLLISKSPATKQVYNQLSKPAQNYFNSKEDTYTPLNNWQDRFGQ